MSIREYQFITGIETSTSPDPATPSADADTITKGFADDTYAQFTSWGTKQTSNANIKAIAVADRSDGQIVFNTATDAMYRFNSGSSAADDGDLVLQPNTGSGRWIKITSGGGSSSGDSLVYSLEVLSSGITAGEALSASDAVCLAVHNGTGSNVYRVFKADADNGARRGFIGFAKSAVTVTPQITTYTISAAYVTGNTIPFSVNGRDYSVSYASSSDATLQALATAIEADPDILTATVIIEGGNQTGTDDRIVQITSVGGLSLNISGTTITGGASQPTVTMNTSQSASGGAVDIHNDGQLGNFTSLSVGYPYYLSDTAGGVTASPTSDNPIYVGTATLSTVMFCKQPEINIASGNGQFLHAGGYNGSSALNVIESFYIAQTSNAVDFGDLSATTQIPAGIGGNVRAIFSGGYSGGYLSTLQYWAFNNAHNTTSFGSLSVARSEGTGSGNSTRGLTSGGYTGSVSNVIDYIVINTVGSAVDFGDLTSARRGCSSTNSTTRTVVGGGSTGSYVTTMDYVEIGTTGNATSFGSLTVARGDGGGASSATRGLFMGGQAASTKNEIDYITFVTIASASDFGDLTSSRTTTAGSTLVRACAAGGFNGSSRVATIDYVTIASTGNATSFGSLTEAKNEATACTNAHGGLS